MCSHGSLGSQSRASVTDDTRDRRLARQRASQKQRLASETGDERETRLSQRRWARERACCEARSSQDRDTHLKQIRVADRGRRALETPSQRNIRLSRARLNLSLDVHDTSSTFKFLPECQTHCPHAKPLLVSATCATTEHTRSIYWTAF